MPSSMRGDIEGLREAREALNELGRTVARNIGKRALVAPAELLVSRLKANTPVSNRRDDKTPGSLRDSTKHVVGKAEKGRPRRAVLIEDVAAVPNEFGTSKMKAQPYVRRTVDANREAAAAVLAEAIKAEIEPALKRAARKGARKG